MTPQGLAGVDVPIQGEGEEMAPLPQEINLLALKIGAHGKFVNNRVHRVYNFCLLKQQAKCAFRYPANGISSLLLLRAQIFSPIFSL
jgi:hypothetical protein